MTDRKLTDKKLADGPDGMKKRIDREVPEWRDIIVKAGIKP
jgi:hypothetical protein